MNDVSIENDSTSRFYQLFSRNVFYSKHQAYADGEWVTVNHPLKERDIKAYFDGTSSRKVGFFVCINTRMLCLDIDAHNVPAEEVEAICATKAQRVRALFGIDPSAMERTNHGLHFFYFLTDWVNSQWFTEGVKATLNRAGIDVEVAGTWNVGLSVPRASALFNVTCEEYPTALLEALFPAWKPHERMGSTIPLIFENGNTNASLCYVVPHLKGKGYTDEQIADTVTSWLDPSYDGELRDIRRLTRRIASFDEHPTRKSVPEGREEHPDLDGIMKTVLKKLSRQALSPAKARSLRRIVDTLLWAKDDFEGTCSCPEGLWYDNAIHPFTAYYHRMGATPVPSTLLRGVNTHYAEFVRLLIEIGFLTLPTGRHYDVRRHACIHYVIGFKARKSRAKTTRGPVTADSCPMLPSRIPETGTEERAIKPPRTKVRTKATKGGPEKGTKKRAIKPCKWDSFLLEARARAKAKVEELSINLPDPWMETIYNEFLKGELSKEAGKVNVAHAERFYAQLGPIEWSRKSRYYDGQ
jgi:hypothetical protein